MKKHEASDSFDLKELNYLQDTDFLLTKHQINKKLLHLLEQARQKLKQEVETLDLIFPEGTDIKNGKTSKGEQYRYLPYWVLDYPRKYTQDDIFAFRTMIWWGNEVSCTLMLAEQSWEQYQEVLLQNLVHQTANDWYINVNTTPWEYHFEVDNYRKISEFSPTDLTELFQKMRFVKVSRKLELSQLPQLPQFTLEVFQDVMKLLQGGHN